MPSEPNPALQSMADALSKSLRALPRKKRAVVDQRLELLQSSGLDQFLGTYRELVAVSARLESRLDADDPLRTEMHAALGAARAAWGSLLSDGEDVTTSPDPTGADSEEEPEPEAAAEAESAPHSVALVRTSTEVVLAVRRRGRQYPDEAALVRYLRNRQQTHRWPDEAVIKRYLRNRQARGPRYPDQAALTRWLRERHELS